MMLQLHAGDSRPYLDRTLMQKAGSGEEAPLDLTGCDVTFEYERAGTAGLIVKTVEVTDVTGGKVRVAFTDTETAVTKTTQCSGVFRVTDSEGNRFSVPNTREPIRFEFLKIIDGV